MGADYAYVKINTTTSNISTSLLPVFDTDLSADMADGSIISPDITWGKTAGTFTFTNAGTYHIVATLITEQATSNSLQTVQFLIGASVSYTTAVLVSGALAYDPVEHTHQTILTVDAGDVLTIKTTTAANTMTVNAGSTLLITEITSGIFAKMEVTTSGTAGALAEFDPFDTGDDGTAMARTLSAGITSKTASVDKDNIKIVTAGTYAVMISNIHDVTTSSASNNTIKVYKNDAEIYTTICKSRSTDDPTDSTIFLILVLAADDELGVTWDWGASTSSHGLVIVKGSVFSVYKLDTVTGVGQDAYITVESPAQSTAAATAFSPFDKDSYGSAPTYVTHSSSNITFEDDDGTFTVGKTGLYHVVLCGAIEAATDAIVTYTILVNSVSKLSAAPKMDSAPDPKEATISALLDLRAGDVVTATIDSDGANITSEIGFSLSLYKILKWFHSEEDAIPAGLITTDFTFNSFSQDNLSAQFDRDTVQVPFVLGIPGPLSLRGRPFGTTAASNPANVSMGDKKNN